MKKTNTRTALNPAYRKHKPLRKDVASFIEHLKECIESIKISDEKGEFEEHLKEPIKKFLKNTFYQDNLINTKDYIDLAIYLDKTSKSDVGVIIEAKRPSNKTEFISEGNLNKKALQELLLYYLRERLDGKNNNIKHLIATNGYEWFLFKAEDFYNLFFKNKKLIKEYEDFRDGLKDTSKNELFYDEIAKKHIEKVKDEIPFVHIDFRNVNFDSLDDNKLNTYFKIFSNVHLLGHSFGNDSNQLNKNFYVELLHIIGLEDVSEGGKRIIRRKLEADRDYASLLENTIFTLEDKDYLRKVTTIENSNDKSFNVGLELCLTWINRILFLKLLESQLALYHKGAKEYKFLNSNFIDGFDSLNDLFFSGLAKPYSERHEKFKDTYKYIPYLNSSLFSLEEGSFEDITFSISSLKDDKMIVHSSTILKDSNGKRFKGKLKTLDYLFKFLDSYDFATDGTEGIIDGQESKALINASVLGLIFEKINGYKDGSFYTPAYITMYMCKETIQRAIAKKFKEYENESIENFEDVKAYCHRFFKVEEINRFNQLVNSIRICDPAVGSGHFLVSAINELISVKKDLGILVDENGIQIRVDIQIENDELFITDANGNLFEYNPNNIESAIIQKTLFEEKQNLIENCLFGVDINPNSVKICRLRLWIELLKNAYYTDKKELHTLPNIDINIKCGNSLISRFKLTDNLKDAFKGKEVKYSFIDYKEAVIEYKNTNSKERKQQVLNIIEEVKNNLKSVFYTTLKENKDLANYRGQLINIQTANIDLFGTKLSKSKVEIEEKRLKLLIKQQEEKVKEISSNAIYKNAFEWRFEFPEVLDDNGEYIGFDVVIGNPPYGVNLKENEITYYRENYNIIIGHSEVYYMFIELGLVNLLKKNQILSYIIPNAWLSNKYASKLREFLIKKFDLLELINFNQQIVFEDAQVETSIVFVNKSNSTNFLNVGHSLENKYSFNSEVWLENENSVINFSENKDLQLLLLKISNTKGKISNYFDITNGCKPYQAGYGKNLQNMPLTKDDVINRIYHSDIKNDNNHHIELKGKNILPYSTKKSSKYINWGNWLMSPKDKKYYFQSKILIRQIIGKSFIANIDNSNAIADQSLYILIPLKKDNEISLKFCLGIINSKLYGFYFRKFYSEEDDLFPKIKVNELKNLPFLKPTDYLNDKIESNVVEILSIKEENIDADTSILEREIDIMVYELFGLNEEEISIIENS